MKTDESLWVVIHMVNSLERAKNTEDMLTSEGFLVKLRSVAKNITQSDGFYEIMVLKSEAQEARDLLVERGL